MSTVLFDSTMTDDERRRQIYEGTLFTYAPRQNSTALTEHAWQMITDAFGGVDPRQAQDRLSVEKFVEAIAPLKTAFTHSERSKELIRDTLAELGCDTSATYFDVPRLRIVSHSGYLTSGAGYAFNPHRDIWYAAPPSQHNWWLPIQSIGTASAMAFHPQWWDKPVPNSSDGFDPYRWNATARRDAAKYVKSDSRPHPEPTEPIELEPDIRFVGEPGSVLVFSAAHLHSTVPNTSGRTRFSIDFRTTHIDDLVNRLGAPNVDTAATGTTLRDFRRVDDLAPLPDDIVAIYDHGSTHEGELVFDPATL